MAEKQLTFPGTEVKKSNNLARAKIKDCGVWELRIIDIVASMISKDDKPFKEYIVPAQASRYNGSLGGRDIEQIDNACDNLTRSNVRLSTNTGEGFIYYALFSKCAYESGFIKAQFHPDLLPLFLERKQYTIYSLFESLALPSGYINKLFQILKSWDDRPDQKLTLEFLHDTLDLPQSLRTRYSNLKARILEPAKKYIHQKTTLVYEYEEIKEGRKVVAIRFIFSTSQIEKFRVKREAGLKEKKLQKEKREAKKKMKQIKEASTCYKNREAAGTCAEDMGAVCKTCKSFYWKSESTTDGNM